MSVRGLLRYWRPFGKVAPAAGTATLSSSHRTSPPGSSTRRLGSIPCAGRLPGQAAPQRAGAERSFRLRENYHVLWLKYSCPLRRLFLEIERRLIAVGSVQSGDIFFHAGSKVISATGRLPAPLPRDLAQKSKNVD